MSKKLWLSLKKNSVMADVYYKGQKVCTLSVHDDNRTIRSIVSIDLEDESSFKVIKQDTSQYMTNEDFFNKEEFNK